MGLMDGRVCIVTGAGGSIGTASARLLAEQGASVMLVDNREDNLAAALDGLGGESDSAAAVQADVASVDDTQRRGRRQDRVPSACRPPGPRGARRGRESRRTGRDRA